MYWGSPANISICYRDSIFYIYDVISAHACNYIGREKNRPDQLKVSWWRHNCINNKYIIDAEVDKEIELLESATLKLMTFTMPWLMISMNLKTYWQSTKIFLSHHFKMKKAVLMSYVITVRVQNTQQKNDFYLTDLHNIFDLTDYWFQRQI